MRIKNYDIFFGAIDGIISKGTNKAITTYVGKVEATEYVVYILFFIRILKRK